ncbi:rieske domain-containing protein, partial [Haematococcus lacustris]
MVIGDHILGRPNPWAELYSPGRTLSLLSPSSLQDLGQAVALTTEGLGSVPIPRGPEDVKGLVLPNSVPHLKPGEGAVVQQGLQKVAVYCDPKTGELHKRSALCTH